MNILLNTISVVATFIVSVGLIWLILDNTIGRFRFMKSTFNWYGFQVKDFIFISLSSLFILCFFDFYLPY